MTRQEFLADKAIKRPSTPRKSVSQTEALQERFREEIRRKNRDMTTILPKPRKRSTTKRH